MKIPDKQPLESKQPLRSKYTGFDGITCLTTIHSASVHALLPFEFYQQVEQYDGIDAKQLPQRIM